MSSAAYGTAGADTLSDTQGSTLVGGLGDDTYIISNPNETIVEAAGGGLDTVKVWSSYTLADNLENLVVQGSALTGIGNTLANVITAQGRGDFIAGLAGNDTLIDVGAGSSIFSFGHGSGTDVLQGFNTSAASHDFIQLTDYGFTSFAQVQSHLTQVGADVQLQLDASDTVTIKNVTVGSLSADDFLLQTPGALGQMTFGDEFNSLSLYDQSTDSGTWKTNYWFGTQTGPDSWGSRTVGGGDQVLRVDPSFTGGGSQPLGLNPFSIDNGVVSLTLAKATPAELPYLHGQQYTDGLLTTEKSFAQTYGYFEIKAEAPAGSGLWPSFYLLPKDNGVQEIDITEQAGKGYSFSTDHTTAPGYTTSTIATEFAGQGDGQFHTYGLLWTPQTLTYYIDGVAVGRVDTPPDLDKPMYLLVDMGAGGSWPGDLSSSFTSASYKVDYVHVYALPFGETDSYGPDGTETKHFAGVADHPYVAYDETYSAAAVLTGKVYYDATGHAIETDIYQADGSHTAHIAQAAGSADLSYDATGDVVGEVMHDASGQATSISAMSSAGAAGAVSYVGTDGADNVVGTAGNDFLLLLGGNDTVYGGAGADTIFGNAGDDHLLGEDGNDALWGGQGDDVLDGGAGDNLLFGNLGADTLYAGAGADSLYGGKGDDLIVGGAGDNYLSGDLGDDTLTGGGGRDTFVIAPGTGHDVITDFVHGQDRLDISAFLAAGHTETFSQVQQGLLLTADTGDSVLFLGLHMGDLSISSGWVV